MPTITLSPSEVAMLSDFIKSPETLEAAFHRLLLPMVEQHGETRLQTLAEAYRALTPDLQLEALQVLKTWKDAKGIR